MEYNDLKRQFLRIEDITRRRMDAVLAHGQFIMGPEVKELEERLATRVQSTYCITCASGTMALDLILDAWGIGPGDAVFTTPFSFFATAESIAKTGATPVFVDINPQTFNMDSTLLGKAVDAVNGASAAPYPLPGILKEKLCRARAIVTVDIFGHPASYEDILRIARNNSLLVLEDGAQSFGGEYRGRPLCGCGCDASAASFFPAKPLGCYGDGGAVFTDDKELAERVDSLRYHGRKDAANKNDNVRLGTNGRLDTLQAAILLAKLDVFDDEIGLRQMAAERYHALLAKVPDVAAPLMPRDGASAWAQYTVKLPKGIDRQRVVARMKESGIPTAVFYPKGLHAQDALAYLDYSPEDFPVVQDICSRVLSLPMHPYITEEEQQAVVTGLRSALNIA